MGLLKVFKKKARVDVDDILKVAKFVQLAKRLDDAWDTVKDLQPGQTGSMPLIKTKIDGKLYHFHIDVYLEG